MQVCKVWCEYDINQEYYVFASQTAAEKWVDEALEAQDFTESRDELEGAGLIGYEWLTVIE